MSIIAQKKTYFSDSWLQNEEYSQWIKKCENDENAFFCSWCCKKVTLSNMGIQAIKKTHES